MDNLFDIRDKKAPVIIAGPCSAESESQVLSTARALKEIGIDIFRAGVWKPRTKPGCFEGVGSKALEWLRRVKDETGMAVATEVATSRHVKDALDADIDILWIGARTTTNPFAVQEIADALQKYDKAKRDKINILIKNPVNPDIELWIGAIERIRRAGIRNIGAIHRGFSSYGPHIYRNPPEWRIPIELKRRMPDLGILCDPSHISGKSQLVGLLSQEALDMNFDGLIIESHINPEIALSDSEQQVTPSQLKDILSNLIIRDDRKTTESLEALRRRLDSIDNELLEILARRMEVAREIGKYKKEQGMSVVQPERYKDLIKNRVQMAEELGLGEKFIQSIMSTIHEESVRQQISNINN